MIVGVLTTCHTQYTWDSSICVSLFNRTTLPVFVTYLTGALYVHPLWFYKHQHDNRVRSKLFVACQWWWFQWRFWFVPSVPGYKGCTYRAPVRYVTKTWSVVLLDKKKHVYSYLKCIVYDKLIKPRQSFRKPLYYENLSLYFHLLTMTEDFIIYVTVKAFMPCGLPRPDVFEEFKVCTVHRSCYWKISVTLETWKSSPIHSAFGWCQWLSSLRELTHISRCLNCLCLKLVIRC